MHWDKLPKEKPCQPQRTVKKLLEEKRQRETAAEPSACSESSFCSSAVPPPTAPVCTAETSLATGMAAVGYYYGQWAPGGPGLDPTGPLGCYYTSSPAGGSAAYSPAAATMGSATYSTAQQGYGGDDAVAATSLTHECPMTSSTSSSWPWLVAPHGPPHQASVATPQASVGTPQAVCWGPPDAARLQEARMFLTGMDHALTTCQDEDGDTILHIYCAKGLREHAVAAAERLRAVGRLDTKEHMGKTALLVAVAANQPLIVGDLLALGADANACDVHGQTPLHLAATYGLPDPLQVLLLNGPGVNLEARNFEGLTPLHCATMAHGLATKSLHGSRGVSATDVGLGSEAAETFGVGDVGLRSEAAETFGVGDVGLGSEAAETFGVGDVGLRSEAAETFGVGDVGLGSEAAETFGVGDVGLGSEAAETFGVGDVGLRSRASETFSCLQMLLAAGADHTSQEIKSNATALHLAVKDGNTELVTYLLSCCPLLDCGGKDFVNMKAHGHTALHMAAGLRGNRRQEEMLRLLLSNGADASARNHENQQPAHLLQSGPLGDKLKVLLKKKRSVPSRRRHVQ